MTLKSILFGAAPILGFCVFFYVMPFCLLRLNGVDLKELPFMFIALIVLTKLFLSKSETDQGLKRMVLKILGKNKSKQAYVDAGRNYRLGQDIGLLVSAVAIFVINVLI